MPHFTSGLIGLLSLSLLIGCNATSKSEIALTMQVQPAGRPGAYLISGTTNLPDQSRIRIQGIRYLASTHHNQTADRGQQDLTYSILGRQVAEVSQGKWQATLTLWQVASDGRYQEAWQRDGSGNGRSPSPDVVVLAMVEPAGQTPLVREALHHLKQQPGSSIVRFNRDGQQYLQIQQPFALALPSGKTTPQPEAPNGGWGDRAKLQGQGRSGRQAALPAVKQSQTNAPLGAAQVFR